MSVLTWVRDKLFGKSYVKTVEPQITDAVTTEKVTESTTKPRKAKSAPKKTAKKVSTRKKV